MSNDKGTAREKLKARAMAHGKTNTEKNAENGKEEEKEHNKMAEEEGLTRPPPPDEAAFVELSWLREKPGSSRPKGPSL